PIVMALGQQWHCDCFRCSVCDSHLHSWYFERENLLYCREDYYARFGDACQQCTAVITGPVMVAGEHKFHPECFCCAACGAFIGEGESYALVERSKLYCGQCYGKRLPLDARARARITNAGKPMHSIRLVEIPKDATPGLRVDGGALDDGCPTVRITDLICKFYGRIGSFAFSLLTTVADRCCFSYRIDVNLTQLQIGDRILEVNGTPVSNSSVEQIDKLIRSNEKMLQLTVEHDPVQVCRSCSQADIQRACSASTLVLPLSTSASSVEVGRQHQQQQQQPKSTAAPASVTPATVVTPILKEKERCSSLSKLLDEQHAATHPQLYDLARTQSCRVVQKPQRIFRASDLVMGEKLGEGFFGKVYKVTHRLTGELMVLKELHRADEEAQRNFIKEVAVLRLLDHRHVLKFIGVLYKDKKLHMVTEYVAGGCLKELIHNPRQSLSWRQRLCLARDIACGMSYLHSMNIIHRDLNSMNCLLREDRSVIVADFGLARSVDAPRLPGTSAGAGAGAMDSLSPAGSLRRSKSRQRRQRYTVVGNPYWMAPEMMRGLKYDEKVDVFSFGIMLCEIIGRVEADPDYMPRNSDFSLNEQEFREKYCSTCPEPFLKLAFVCCELNPDLRPCFEVLYCWLEQLQQHLEAPPAKLLHEIDNFQDSYASSEDALSPTTQRSLDNLTLMATPAATPAASPAQEEKENMAAPEEQQQQLLQDIPKSPHLGKDFSPSGERLRDSMRARRRQRLGRGLSSDNASTERALKQALKKCRPFGEKGYLVDLRPGAELQLQDVRDLNSYSDVDSSCDTSLNYHEVNATPTPDATPTPPPPAPAPPEAEAEAACSSTHREAFDHMRERLQQCRSKFEHLQQANQRNFNASQHSMRSFFKTPPVALKMFQRLEHEAALRINQTPIFERRQLPATPIKHAESLEHLNKAAAPAKRSKALQPLTTAAPTTVAPAAAAVTTTATTATVAAAAPAADYLPKKHKLTLPLPSASQQQRQYNSSSKTKAQKAAMVAANSNNSCVSPTRQRPSSPSKHLAQRHTAATAQRQHVNGKRYSKHSLAATHQSQSLTAPAAAARSTRLNILSPEKVHRLSARLSDQKQKLRDDAAAALSASSNGHARNGGVAVSSTPGNAATERRSNRRAAPPPPPPVRTHFNTRC
ncbi:LIMK1, partial [Drosophila busckii]